MEISSQAFTLSAIVATVMVGSFVLSRRAKDATGFFDGRDHAGAAPGVWTLAFSQATTWIFARSLLNAAILGFYYGAPGVLAYTTYYASFLTGWMIVDRLRFRHGATSVQGFLRDRFGRWGDGLYNVVVALRLLSEVFANLLVIGLIFDGLDAESLVTGDMAMLGLAALALAYSLLGGLRASLKTDVLQMWLFVGALALALISMAALPDFTAAKVLTAEGVSGAGHGWVLLLVAALQALSYPMHDPVMMDRGLIADRAVTRASFLHAFWMSSVAIFAFGLIGAHAGVVAAAGETMQAVWARLYGPVALVGINAALVVSAISTLDSAMASAARLAIVEMRLAKPSLLAGRLAMTAFMAGGLALSFWGSKDLFAAVAVSGTASMFLAPVVVFSILGSHRAIPVWSYVAAFAASVSGAALYFFVDRKAEWAIELTGGAHKYSVLLAICIVVLAVGFAAFLAGVSLTRRRIGA